MRNSLSSGFHGGTTVTKCDGPDCNEEGKKRCAKCQQRFYCGPECQKKDWETHKKACKPMVPPPATPSDSAAAFPYGVVFNPALGYSHPASLYSVFFDPRFGFSAADPTRVYADLVDAYRILKLGAHQNAARVPASLVSIEFAEWTERVVRSGALPSWWNAEVNGAALQKFTQDDEWGRIDRVVSRDEIKGRVGARVVVLEMLVERALHQEFE